MYMMQEKIYKGKGDLTNLIDTRRNIPFCST